MISKYFRSTHALLKASDYTAYLWKLCLLRFVACVAHLPLIWLYVFMGNFVPQCPVAIGVCFLSLGIGFLYVKVLATLQFDYLQELFHPHQDLSSRLRKQGIYRLWAIRSLLLGIKGLIGGAFVCSLLYLLGHFTAQDLPVSSGFFLIGLGALLILFALEPLLVPLEWIFAHRPQLNFRMGCGQAWALANAHWKTWYGLTYGFTLLHALAFTLVLVLPSFLGCLASIGALVLHFYDLGLVNACLCHHLAHDHPTIPLRSSSWS